MEIFLHIWRMECKLNVFIFIVTISNIIHKIFKIYKCEMIIKKEISLPTLVKLLFLLDI